MKKGRGGRGGGEDPLQQPLVQAKNPELPDGANILKLVSYLAACLTDVASTWSFIYNFADVGLSLLGLGRMVVAFGVLAAHITKAFPVGTSQHWLLPCQVYLHLCAIWLAIQTGRACEQPDSGVLTSMVCLAAMLVENCLMKSLVFPSVTKAINQGTLINQTDKGPQDIQRMQVSTLLWDIIKAMRKGWLAASILMLIINQGITAWIPKVQSTILGNIVENSKDKFAYNLTIYGVFLSIQPLAAFVAQQTTIYLQGFLNLDLSLKLYSSFTRQDFAFYDTVTVGQMMSRLSTDLPQAVAPVAASINTILADVVLLGMSLGVCWTSSWRLSLVVFTVMVPVAQVIMESTSWIAGMGAEALRHAADAASVANESLNNIRTTRMLGMTAVGQMRENYMKHMEGVRSTNVRSMRGILLVALFGTAVDNMATVILYACGGYFLLGGKEHATVEAIAPFMLLWRQMSTAFHSVFMSMGSPLRAMGAAERVFSVLNLQPSIKENEGEEILVGQGISVDFKAVSFAYLIPSPTGERQAETLRGLFLQISAGSNHALVGDTAAGKTTVFKLLLRNYEATEGSISVNGVDLQRLNLESFRRRVGVISQTSQIFRMSVAKNISYGLGDCSMDAIREAAKLAQLTDSIEKFDDGFDHECNQRTLSGGELQRLSFARAIVRRPALMLLDEHTASLSTAVEQKLVQTMTALRKDFNPTTITIAHRPSTFQSAEKIWVLKDGKVAQSGTHTELIEQGGEYTRLLNIKAGEGGGEEASGKNKEATGKNEEELQTVQAVEVKQALPHLRRMHTWNEELEQSFMKEEAPQAKICRMSTTQF